MLKTKTWVILLAVIVLLSGVGTFFFFTQKPEGHIVEIRQDGTCIETIDLDKVKEPYSFVVEDPHGGSNTILVEPGRIRISEADCPDQVCVKHSWLGDSAAPIVCLPHRLVIQMQGSSSIDTVTQ